MPHPVRRVAALLLISSVAVATQAAPAAAATTRDVAPTGKGGGSCATPDHRTIAAAIKASKKGDTILVCPGTYKGALYMGKAGLTIKATKAGKARITTGKPDDESIIWIDGAPSVTLRGLRLVAPTTGCTAPDQHHRDRRGDHGCDQRRPLHGRCDRVARVRNQRATAAASTVRTTRTAAAVRTGRTTPGPRTWDWT